MKKGEVYWVDLSPGVGREFAGVRQCIVDEIYDEDLIRVIPFSVLDNRYHREQARTVDVERFRGRVESAK